MNLTEYDIFLITKDNGKEQKDMFFGYKTVGEEGFGLDVKALDNQITITGSVIQPPIAVFRQDSYGAISNSVKALKNFLLANGYNLTDNKACFKSNQGIGLNIGYCIEGYSEQDTLYNEIRLTPNFSYIKIIDGELQILPTSINLFSIDLSNNKTKNIISEGFSRYQGYLQQIVDEKNKLCVEVSGGIDSRFLINLGKDIDVTKITCNWSKRGDSNEITPDGMLGRLAISYFTNQTNKLNGKLAMPQIKSKLDDEIADLFGYGISLNQELAGNVQWRRKDDPTLLRAYKLSGVGTEGLKEPTANNLQFVITTIRRYFIPKFLHQYYFWKIKTILPFLDSKLMQLRGRTDRNFLTILFLLYNPAMLDIPFYTGGLSYWISDSDKEIANAIIKEWNKC